VYYGECNQICGQNHSKMPIAVHAVTDAEFKTWIEQTKKAASANSKNDNVLAAAEPTGSKDVQR
jgi:cytochrome c oxidase subunit 2